MSLPANMLRQIYARADPRVQARMRVASKNVSELRKPSVPAPVLLKPLLAAQSRVQSMAGATGAPLSLHLQELAMQIRKLIRGVKEGWMHDLGYVKIVVRKTDQALAEVRLKYGVTAAELSRAAANRRTTLKFERTPFKLASVQRERQALKAQRRVASAAERRRVASAAAMTTSQLVPGRPAPMAVLRGGTASTLADAVAASQSHPVVTGYGR